MSSDNREKRRREKANPRLEAYEITVNPSYGEELAKFLRDKGIKLYMQPDDSHDTIHLNGEPDTTHVQSLLDEWVSGG